MLQENLEEYEQYYTRWYVPPLVRKETRQGHLDARYKEAMEIYLTLKKAFINAGRYDDASWAYVKERQMERKTYFPPTALRYYDHELPF